jgi:hypothetical protein
MEHKGLEHYILYSRPTNELQNYFKQDTENYGPVHDVTKSKRKNPADYMLYTLQDTQVQMKIWQQRIVVASLLARQPVTHTLSCLNLLNNKSL